MPSKQPQPEPREKRPANVPTPPPSPAAVSQKSNAVRQAKAMLTDLLADRLELITWIDPKRDVPTDSRDVMVRIQKANQVVTWVGYWSAANEVWRDIDGFEVDVIWWSEKPEGPQ
jgi:hypothetical protein